MSRLRCCWLCLLLVLQPSTAGTARVSDVAALVAEPSVRAALDAARRFEEDTIQQQIRICEIPAPPFGEAKRAAAYAQAMRAAGLANVRIEDRSDDDTCCLGHRASLCQRSAWTSTPEVRA